MTFIAQHWPELTLATVIVIWGAVVAYACSGGRCKTRSGDDR